nr:DUF411 domain-containing protein [Roseibium alexandrii]
MMTIDRRALLQGVVSLCVATPTFASATGTPAIHVLKARGCGCCNAWIDIMRSEGFSVRAEDIPPGLLAREKVTRGIPTQLASCHTALIDGYVVEGHVPAPDVRRLIADRPEAVGLSVPGMPYGSPGMGPETEREAYDVLLVLQDGSFEVFSSYPAAA